MKSGKGEIYSNKLSHTNHQDNKKCMNLNNESENETPTSIKSTHGNKSSTEMNKSLPSNLRITNSKSEILQTSQTLYQKRKEFWEEMKDNLE